MLILKYGFYKFMVLNECYKHSILSCTGLVFAGVILGAFISMQQGRLEQEKHLLNRLSKEQAIQTQHIEKTTQIQQQLQQLKQTWEALSTQTNPTTEQDLLSIIETITQKAQVVLVQMDLQRQATLTVHGDYAPVVLVIDLLIQQHFILTGIHIYRNPQGLQAQMDLHLEGHDEV